MKKKRKQSLGERICNALDLSAGILPHGTLIEIHGQNLVKIQGAGRILLYTDGEIRISLRGADACVRVRGSGLSCSSYNMGAVGIHGNVEAVDFCDGREKDDGRG